MNAIKKVIGCTVTITIIICLIYKLGILVRPANTDIAFNAIDAFHDMPENSLEVIGYGSSKMWRGMDPMEMYAQYGIGAYNYGCNWQHINTTELFIKDSLLTQSPKVILIETYLINDVLKNIDMNGEIYYTRALPESEGKRQYLKQCFGDDKERYLSYYVPLCAFHDNWTNLSESNFLKNADDTDFYSTMGFVYKEDVVSITIPDPLTFEQADLSEDAIEILDEIVSICKENSIDIIFYTAPYQGTYAYSDAMKKYAAENGCAYFNLFECIEEIGIDGETDFSDAGHLNNSGAVKVADFLSEYIVNNYDVTDMRTIEGNIWEQNLH
ncbi:MAG: hypothetical protein J1E61_00560 [Lachnospiraceae bacterium]|nr:hypothetical protein [Lachnospiraceae bacterium]